MKTIAITPRVNISEHGERFEALAQQWGSWLSEWNVLALQLSYHPAVMARQLAETKPSLVILSGGNDIATLPDAKNIAPERDSAEQEIISWAMKHKKPVLGICRGMQMLNMFFGGTLARVSGHAGTRHPVALEPSGESFDVNSYHEWGIPAANLAPDMVAIARDDSGNIEAMQHKTLPLFGVMWHPEREQDETSDCRLMPKQFIRRFL